jgi:tRNA A37 methylthiotransferase MiaB
MKYHIITYGCQMNTADSEEMAQPLKERGFLATADPQTA